MPRCLSVLLRARSSADVEPRQLLRPSSLRPSHTLSTATDHDHHDNLDHDYSGC